MYIENISPVIFEFGPFSIRWYGLMFAISVLIGFYYLKKYGLKKGITEEFIFSFFIIMIVSVVIGARAVYVIANWPYFMDNLEMIPRIDRGGLAFHGGLLGGVLSSWIYCRLKNVDWPTLADLAVPGITIGITLVRIANIFNQEILGRHTLFFPFDRHPTQIYGSLIGLLLLLLHNYLARRRENNPGYLFWIFVLGYTLLRGLIEETFRDNPLVVWNYSNEILGVGFFTLVQVFTPFLIILSLIMLYRTNKS
ncbi:MAG: prolipoprotein diacylglyceryl transferase [Bacillota bacterium]|nr:prolipoprotein diacylglyceryl transferase [Bacillota bacterium]